MPVRVQLEKIVGPQNVFDDQETLNKYSKDQSSVSPANPDFVIFPQSTEEIQEITRLANQTKTPLIPFSSGLNFYDVTIPCNSDIILPALQYSLAQTELDWNKPLIFFYRLSIAATALYKSHPWPRPGLSVVEHPTGESHQGRQGGPIVSEVNYLQNFL